MQAAVGQLHLRLHPYGRRDPPPTSPAPLVCQPAGQVVQQGALAHARLAAQDEDAARVCEHIGHQLVERGTLVTTSEQLAHYAISSGTAGSAARSSRRELMPSLVKILRRCHSTVRADRNSWAAISELVWPLAASRAMCASCAVSVLTGSAARWRTISPVASSSRRARSANASAPMPASRSCAVRSCSRASARRFSRRSHSP